MLAQFKYTLFVLISLALACAGMGCSSDDGGEEPEPKPVVPLTVVKQSIADGSEVPVSTSAITIEYSHPIALSNSQNATLNGSVVIPTVSNKTLTINLTLEEGKSYQLAIPKGAVVRKDDSTVKADALSVSFKTPDVVKPGNIAEITNPNASAQAKNVYDYLISMYGKKILSGAMANVNNNNEFSDLIYNTTQKHPAVTGYDFIHLAYSPANWIDYSNITPAKTQWNANGLVAYMWHWLVPPTEGAKVEDYTYEANKGFDIREALKDGTWQNKHILADIDKVAGYLKLLQDAGIPVIWRPLHEAAGSYSKWQANGAWFWWGDKGTEYTKKLWILMHDRLVEYHKLNNLIWVWTVQVEDGYESDAVAAYPGDEYVDIVGTDIYADDTEAKKSQFDFINNNITHGKKLIALSECGNIPNPDKCIASGDSWSWFMVWYSQKDGKLLIDGNYKLNTSTYWKSVMSSKNVVNREDMPSLK